MARELELRRPEGDDDEQAVVLESREKVAEEVDCGCVGPVDVLEEEDERTDGGDLLDECGELAL
jgi:hypothetical protein